MCGYNLICFSPNSKYLASVINYTNIIIWDCDNNFDEIANIFIDTKSIISLKFSIDGKFLLVENIVKFLLVETNETKLVFLDSYNNYIEELSLYNANNVIISPCGKFVVYTNKNILIVLDCYCNFSILKTISTLQPNICILGFALDGNFLAIGWYNGEIIIFDCNNDFTQIRMINSNEDIQTICFSPINNNKMYLAIIYFSNTIKIFDCYDNFNQIYTLDCMNHHKVLFSPITESGENFLIAFKFGKSKYIEVWDCNNAFVKSKILTTITNGTVCFKNDIKSTVLW